MRIARIETPTGVVPVLDQDGVWVAADPAARLEPLAGGRVYGTDAEVEFVSPTTPLVVLGMLHNSGAADRELPPQAFQKTVRTVSGPGDAILVGANVGIVKGEGELALVVGKTCRFVTPAQAPDYVLGWTIGNDVTSREQAALDSTFTQAKGGDGYQPLGPWIETDLDPNAAPITVAVNGQVVCQSSTAELARNAYEVLSYISQYLTLDAGDVILTGAPDTSADIAPGDVIAISIPGLGTLQNPVLGHPAVQ